MGLTTHILNAGGGVLGASNARVLGASTGVAIPALLGFGMWITDERGPTPFAASATIGALGCAVAGGMARGGVGTKIAQAGVGLLGGGIVAPVISGTVSVAPFLLDEFI
jgi:hypothetical protein